MTATTPRRRQRRIESIPVFWISCFHMTLLQETCFGRPERQICFLQHSAGQLNISVQTGIQRMQAERRLQQTTVTDIYGAGFTGANTLRIALCGQCTRAAGPMQILTTWTRTAQTTKLKTCARQAGQKTCATAGRTKMAPAGKKASHSIKRKVSGWPGSWCMGSIIIWAAT